MALISLNNLERFFNNLKTYISNALNSKANSTHTHSASDITSGLATVATSGSYNDLSNKPTIPTVNNATLTIQKNGTAVQTFTANQSTNATANITVPTKTSDLTNDSGFLTSSGSCNYATSAGSASSATTAGAVSTSVAADSTKNLVYSSMADNDFCRIMCGGASNAGYMEIATADDGNEPIYVRQYTGVFGSITRTLTLLDGSGNTQFPGTVTAPTFSGNLNGSCSGTAGSVAWGNVSGRPTALSQFTNDSGFITSADLLPIGSYIQFAGSQAPAGFLVCNGGAISRTTYSKLFAVIGTTYGSGDGSTTFNLPNLTDRFLQGSTTSGTVINAGLPNITGYVDFHGSGNGLGTVLQKTSGCFVSVNKKNRYGAFSASAGASSYDGFDFIASESSSIYGNSSTVQPPALTCLICIKY